MKSIYVLIIAVLVLTGGYYFLSNNGAKEESLETRQQMIHEKGSAVMPFDLDKTTHIFNQTDTGGIQQVKVKDINDVEQIELIQEHLQQEAENFNSGNFADPENLHGNDMPGLEVLRNNPDKYSVVYIKLEDGAQLTYITEDPEVLEAFHMWFMAQLMDHGNDATTEMH